jgi:hypothetical protein
LEPCWIGASRAIGVGWLLLAAAAAPLVGLLLTDYPAHAYDGQRGQGVFWWLLLTAWPLQRTYQRGDLARRVARAVFALGLFLVLALALPGLTAGDGQAWYWYPYTLFAQSFGLLVVCSPVVRAWCAGDASLAVGSPPAASV